MPKRVAIIENYHFEVTYTLLMLFDHINADITIFLFPEAFKQLQLMLGENINRYKWIVKRQDEKNRDFVHRIFSNIGSDDFDMFYCSTIDDNHILYVYYLKRLSGEKILTIHNINNYFSFKLGFGIRRIVRYIGKKRLLRTVNLFTVLSENQANYLSQKLKSKKRINVVSGGAFDIKQYVKHEYCREDCIIKIVVPGSIDNRRRNYSMVFKLLDEADKKKLPIHVTLLGGFKNSFSDEILQECIKWNEKHSNLTIYNQDEVEQSEFDKVMSDSHFVWMPLNQTSVLLDGIQEMYGVSTCSGNIGDVIRYAKPFFAPASLNIDKALGNGVVRYNSINEIIDFLHNLTTEAYNSLQEKSFTASQYYTIERIVERNKDLFR